MYLECMSSVRYFPKRQDEGEVMQTYNALYFYLGHSFSPGRDKHCQDRGKESNCTGFVLVGDLDPCPI